MVSQPLKTSTSQGESPAPPPAKKRLAKFLKNTEICKHHQRGHCRFGDKCSYAHGTDELMTRPDFAKTRICAYFLAGCCVNDNCFFAHDQEEVQQSTFKHTESQAELLSGRQSSLSLGFESESLFSLPQPLAWETPKVPRDVHELLLSMSEVTLKEPKGQFPRNGAADLYLPSEQNRQTFEAILQPAMKPGIQPKLNALGRNETHGRQQQVKQTVPQKCSSVRDLHEWLRACDHADHLSGTMEHEIAELFLSDSKWAATFPRLTQQCMWRVSVLSL